MDNVIKQNNNNMSKTIIHRGDVKDPSYKIVVIKENTNDVWFFYNTEEETAIRLYNRFNSKGLNVRLYERLWQKVTITL